MNYDNPREICGTDGKGTGKFRYTSRNDNWIRAIGYCEERNCEHATPDEARECYKEYQLDRELFLDRKFAGQQRKCLVCGEWTQGSAQVGYGIPRIYVLCDAHRNREEVAKLHEAGDSIHS